MTTDDLPRLAAEPATDRPKVGSPGISGVKVWIVAVLSLVYTLVLIKTAWLSDDAYITFRTVDNFIHGYGLTWNVSERVQAYTHPLWMFLLSAFYFLTHEIFFTSLLLSIEIALLGFLIFGQKIPRSSGAALFGMLALITSKAFAHYSTSGLENPLTHLLLIAFFLLYFRPDRRPKTLFLLALIAAAGALDRMDTLLIYLPPLFYTLVKYNGKKGILILLGGFTPFLAWELFSLLYYGFPFPNTAYAKLAIGIPSDELIAQGFEYLFDSLRFDPLMLLTIAAAITVSLRQKISAGKLVILGMALYLGYIVSVGGDFMSGRLLTPVFLGAVILLSQFSPPWRARKTRLFWAAASVAVALVGLITPHNSILSSLNYRAGTLPYEFIGLNGIADERGFYYPSTGLLLSRLGQPPPVMHHPWAIRGQELRETDVKVTTMNSVGFTGFYAGPEAHIVDLMALADPLLARLPAKPTTHWRIGHFERGIPCGYLETLIAGQNRIKDENLAAYYDKLALVTGGELLDLRRWREIWRLNTGYYTAWLDAYRPDPACE